MIRYWQKTVMKSKSKFSASNKSSSCIYNGLVRFYIMMLQKFIFVRPEWRMIRKCTAIHMLDTVIEPLDDILFESCNWCFQQDSVPGHKLKQMQTWLTEHILDFITLSEWLVAGLDLNPLDYQLWQVFEEVVCKWRHAKLDCLMASIFKTICAMPIETIHAVIDAWSARLKACV